MRPRSSTADLYYVAHRSLLLDLRIVARTVRQVLKLNGTLTADRPLPARPPPAGAAAGSAGAPTDAAGTPEP